MLLFKKKFLEAIRARSKTQTVRLWKWRKMKPGQRSYIPGAGYIQIDTVDEVALAELTDDDAVLDGFPSAAALRQEIEQLYPMQLVAGYKAFRIRFTLLPPEVQEQMRAEKKKAAAVRVAGGRAAQ
ncbi:MAG TPA: ASCH domain-containing protein [Pirellulales bacterium]